MSFRNQFSSNLVKSILAGVSISVGGVIYITLGSSILGAFLFSIGLFTIYMFDWNLYTGKCCMLPQSFTIYTPITIIALVGNIMGTVVMGYVVRLSGLSLEDYAREMVAHKLEHTTLEYFILSIFCGILMSIAVLGYKQQKDDFGRFIIIALPITIFIVAKFEHVIANAFYISLADFWNQDTVVFTAVCAIGNMIGCSIICGLKRLFQI